MLANLTIDTLRKRIQSNKAKLDEQVAKGGVQKEMDKLANSIDAVSTTRESEAFARSFSRHFPQDTREMETQVRRQAFSRFAVWQEIRLLHFHKRDVVAMYAGLVHEQARYGNSLVEEWAALAPIVEALPAY